MSNPSTAIALKQLTLPTLASKLAAMSGDDLSSGVRGGFGVASIRGAKWRIVEGGEEKPIYMPGTTDLAPSIRVVILKANPAVSKIYYEGAYVEGQDTKPTCMSNDGVAPSSDAEKPQSKSCAACPKNVWGSKLSPSGAKIKACGDARRVAILPADDLSYSPILLRVPGASLPDLATYGKTLKKAGVPYAAVVTKLSFDPAASYPKILFAFERVLTDSEIDTVMERLDDPVIEDVLGGALPEMPAVVQDEPPVQAQPEPEPPAEQAAAPAKAKATPKRQAAQPQPQPQPTQEQPADPPPSNVVHLQPAAGAGVIGDLEAELAKLSL